MRAHTWHPCFALRLLFHKPPVIIIVIITPFDRLPPFGHIPLPVYSFLFPRTRMQSKTRKIQKARKCTRTRTPREHCLILSVNFKTANWRAFKIHLAPRHAPYGVGLERGSVSMFCERARQTLACWPRPAANWCNPQGFASSRWWIRFGPPGTVMCADGSRLFDGATDYTAKFDVIRAEVSVNCRCTLRYNAKRCMYVRMIGKYGDVNKHISYSPRSGRQMELFFVCS